MSQLLQPSQRGDKGDQVVELQMRLAGFRGGVPDGDYGPATELQVKAFQREFMGREDPDGRADEETVAEISRFGAANPIAFASLHCPCGVCDGFGQGRFKNVFRKPGSLEVFHRYEYPGMHRMLLWAYRAAIVYAKGKGWELKVNSAYRCAIDNANHQRSSSNHHGKAIDIDIIPPAGAGDTDRQRCNSLRGILVEKANAQIGWDGRNRKALEPASIAPTWVHLDVRCFDRKYLDDKYFVKDLAALDAVPQ